MHLSHNIIAYVPNHFSMYYIYRMSAFDCFAKLALSMVDHLRPRSFVKAISTVAGTTVGTPWDVSNA